MWGRAGCSEPGDQAEAAAACGCKTRGRVWAEGAAQVTGSFLCLFVKREGTARKKSTPVRETSTGRLLRGWKEPFTRRMLDAEPTGRPGSSYTRRPGSGGQRSRSRGRKAAAGPGAPGGLRTRLRGRQTGAQLGLWVDPPGHKELRAALLFGPMVPRRRGS